MIIKRDLYLKKLIDRMDNGLIKVITGLRRSGKSFLLFNLFKNYLISSNVEQNHIIEIKLDELSNAKLLNRNNLLKYINGKIVDKGRYYVLLDEIQLVKKFEPLVIQLSRIENLDVYVTGSNSKFLSTDIDTQLNGKNDPIHIYPLTFEEILTITSDRKHDFLEFCQFGGLPQLMHLSNSEDKKDYLSRTLNEMYIKDVLSRNRIKYSDQISDLLKVLASTVGSYVSINNILNTIKSKKHINLKWETISKYIEYLKKAFLINEVERYDLKGRKYIGANKKIYFEDIGLRNCLLNYRQNEITHIFENIVFNELKYHGYSVDVGIVPIKTSTKLSFSEIDFVANKGNEQYLIQACVTLTDDSVINREKKELAKISSASKKYLVTLDEQQTRYIDENGIIVINFFDFIKEI